MKKTLLACTSLFAVLPVVSLAVPTVYTYAGHPYTTIRDDPQAPGTYTTDMRTTGSLTLSEAIGPNSFMETGASDPRLLRFQFNDGRTDFGITDAFLRAGLSTDASGGIERWTIVMRADRGIARGLFETVSGCSSFSACDFAELEFSVSGGPTIADNARNFTLGTWTVVAIPEPSTYVLFVAGVVLVGPAAKRRWLMRKAGGGK
jgi:hypothetical protein